MDMKLSCSVEIYGTNDTIAKENCQTLPTENAQENLDNSETEHNNKDNADTGMNLAYDNCNDDDETGDNDKMDEQKNEEDLTTAEDDEKLESSVGSSRLGSRRSNGGG
eukprot:1337966-Ditylum_brightwellii.AAC.1